MDPVGKTALVAAVARALESERDDRLFEDPYARAVAGMEGFLAFEQGIERADGGAVVEQLALRTYFFDCQIKAKVESGLRQIVMLGAGLDARAFRLRWPPGVRLFEIERPEVLRWKDARLMRAAVRCERHTVGIDLQEDWCTALSMHGFDSDRPTLWVAEGLLVYFEENAVRSLLAKVTEASMPGSIFLCDFVRQTSLETLKHRLVCEGMSSRGSLFQFGIEDPAKMFAAIAWKATVIDPSEIARGVGRASCASSVFCDDGHPSNVFVEARMFEIPSGAQTPSAPFTPLLDGNSSGVLPSVRDE